MTEPDPPPPVPEGESPEGFLSRWSRRKREDAPDDDPPTRPVAEASPPPAIAPEPTETMPGMLARLLRRRAAAAPPGVPLPEFDLASLPSIENLTAESNFLAFLRQGVPLGLRNAALRRMWSLDPAIRDFTGPADYAWDYNAVDGVPGFSLDLGGADLKKLLAQALGQLGDEEEAKPDEPAVAEPAPESPMLLAEATPDPVALPSPVDPDAAIIPAEPEPLTAPEAPETVPATRRHGGALPA